LCMALNLTNMFCLLYTSTQIHTVYIEAVPLDYTFHLVNLEVPYVILLFCGLFFQRQYADDGIFRPVPWCRCDSKPNAVRVELDPGIKLFFVHPEVCLV
jgi:hypothetical protein